MRLYDACKEILKIQKFRRMVSYAGFYGFVTVISYAYTSNTTRAGYSRADQFYASYPAGTELLTDTAKLRLEIALKRKSGDQLNGASWLNTLNVKGNLHTHIMQRLDLIEFTLKHLAFNQLMEGSTYTLKHIALSAK
ncbi:hypothetical protein TEA_013611 [Camellia sinensis var. sinensis]|uniref:Uncharacterized protein n=1 Tax=Camellia sinensis var. sinensis TaxID=542762 RepID=A0A4S4DNV4_CAMSN|nr:hypothetical protein TEA_013611 [Camellia sinensis var. sinensis]